MRKVRKNRRVKQLTYNEIARNSLLQAGYTIVAEESGIVPPEVIDSKILYECELKKINKGSKLYNCIRKAYSLQHTDVKYTVGSGLRRASQGYYFFVGGKKDNVI